MDTSAFEADEEDGANLVDLYEILPADVKNAVTYMNTFAVKLADTF